MTWHLLRPHFSHRPARDNDRNVIIIEKPTDRNGNPRYTCDSYVGWVFRKQIINLQGTENDYDCFTLGTIMHEFIHALGHHHEQNRPDRNDFVSVNLDGLSKRAKGNYRRQTNEDVVTFGLPYDYFSIMHYSGGGRITVKVNVSYDY